MSCPEPTVLAALADGELSENQADAIRKHLEGCATCRATAERMRQVAAALPAALTPPADATFTAEVARRIREERPKRRPVLAGALVAAVACVVFAVVILPRSTQDEFRARGGGEALLERDVGFTAFVHPHSDPSLRRALSEGGVLAPGDGLTFDVRNRTGHDVQLMLFGVDAAGDVHWFYPSWTSNDADPESVRVGPVPQLQSFTEGVTPDAPAPGRFRVVALFSLEPLPVSRIEHAVRQDVTLRELAQLSTGSSLQVLEARVERTRAP